MDISTRIAQTLTLWMSQKPGMETIKQVASRSGVGFGTVRRCKNGDGNITVKNLALIAKAFHRPVEDLIGLPSVAAPLALPAPADNVVSLAKQQESVYLTERLTAIVDAAKALSDEGQAVLLGRAQELAMRYPRAKANHVN